MTTEQAKAELSHLRGIAEGGDISEMVISEVESYIKQNKIYG